MPKFIPSTYQSAIFDFVRQGEGHGLVDAVPGSGKTSTLVEAAKLLSPNCKAIFLAFNKHIAAELGRKLAEGNSPMEASTIHSLGMQALRGLGKRLSIQEKKYHTIARAYLESEQTYDYTLLNQFKKLIAFTQMTLVDPCSEESLLNIIDHYGLEISPYDVEWPILRRGVKLVLDKGVEQAQTWGSIDFNDMVWLPSILNLAPAKADIVFVDEAQDLNAAQLALVMKSVNGFGRLLFVGDKRQCQPAGTMIRLPDGFERPIEQIRPGDEIVTYDRATQMFVKKGNVIDVAARQYDGLLYTVRAGGKESRCTDSHKWLVRWINTDTCERWVTYLMRQGDCYRVGHTPLFLKEHRSKEGNVGVGPAERTRIEQADAAWILKIHDHLADAIAYEHILSARYGFPEVCISQSGGTPYRNHGMVESRHKALAPQEEDARQCLENHGRKLEYPLYTWSMNEDTRESVALQGWGCSTWFVVQACNLIPGFMAIPVAPDDTQSTREKMNGPGIPTLWQALDVATRPYSGLVYSLNIETYHTYIADGLVTCNSIYGFSGADTRSIETIIERTHATVLPLSICYRCPSSHVKMCASIFPGIESAPWAREGTISTIAPDKLEDEVKPGDLIICRTTAPLVETCLGLLRAGVRAKVRGRDIGANFVALINKLKKQPTFRFERFTEILLEYRLQQAILIGVGKDADMKIANLDDKVDTILALHAAYLDTLAHLHQGDMDGFQAYIDHFFSDDQGRMVVLSTVHKAKGLEEERVFILKPEIMPHPKARMGWQLEQEYNLKYVAYSRSKGEMFFVQDAAPSGVSHTPFRTAVTS
jgi:hypothetical protein